MNPHFEHLLHSEEQPEKIILLYKRLEETSPEIPEILEKMSEPQIRMLYRLFIGSNFLVEELIQHPSWLKENFCDEELIGIPKTLSELRQELTESLMEEVADRNYEATSRILREFKLKHIFRIAVRDLNKLGDTDLITLELSNLADVCLQAVFRLSWLKLSEELGFPHHKNPEGNWCVTQFAIIGLGKLGGQELNYSSDVDVIFVYSDEGYIFKETPEPDQEPTRHAMSNHQFFTHLAEAIIDEVSRTTREGQLYRIDLRLRPDGNGAPLVRSFESYENYYSMWGRTWERMMLIKARYVAGSSNLGAEFIEMIHPFRYGAALYALSVRRDDAGKAVFRMVDITGGFQSAEVVSQEIVPFEDGGEGYLAGFGDVENGFIYLYLYDSSAGLARYVIEGEEPEGNIGEVDFRLEKLWSFTDNEGNAPEHIDGTNAQQGGAYKGYFYINDCADKLIYVYGKDGLAGTLPGGSGWGAACDDAGNVIVRDDKNAGNSHILMIYPSGVMPGDDVEAVRLEFDLLDSGQTNFISASGDVLGDGGYVYFYPNGQTVVNMVEIANGEIVDILRSGELSIVSSTAGYVIPYRNNPENWLYMVRNNGIYEYNGTDAGLLVGGSSTRPPLRNSTCGAEYFLLSSHEIVIYNSGANYKGGFTIKDLTENVYVESVSPIGSKGYEEGGNYSVSNWMFAEKIDAGSYYLYQYCPANGIAVYRFWDANYVPDGGVEAVAVDERLSVYPNPAADVLHIDTAEPVSDVAVYSMSGAEVLRIEGESVRQIDVSGLPAGMYVLKADGKVARFVKKF